jgi:hypothetical protein
MPIPDASLPLLALTLVYVADTMRVSFVALGLLALLAVAYAEDVAEPAEYHRKSKHSHKK